MNVSREPQSHTIILDKRHRMEITGVKEVVSFDDRSVILRTVCGELTAEGKDIKINTLDTERGIVSLEGTLDAVLYADTEENNKGRGLFGRLLK